MSWSSWAGSVHPDAIIKLAEELCGVAARRRHTTTEAMALLRRWRGEVRSTKQRRRQPQEGLVGALTAALDQYERRHPGTEPADILEALNEVCGIVQEMMERGR